MKKIIGCVVVAIIIVIGVIVFSLSHNTNKTEEMKTIRLNEVTRSVFYAPQYVAISKGYFDEENLKVDITTGQGADKVMTAVLANQSDIGFAGPEASIYVYNEGKEDYTQVFAQLTQRDGAFLVGRNNEKATFSWDNLKGKTIIPGRKGGVPYMTFEYVLKKNGLNPQTDLALDDSIKFDLMAGAFTGGNADYVTLFEPTASMTENAGKGYVLASIGEASGEIPYTAYFAKKSYIENNKATIQKFTNAIYKGQIWVKTHTAEEIAKEIVSFFPDTDLQVLTNSIQSYKDIEAWSDNPVLKKDSFDLLQNVMTEAGELKQTAPYEKIVNNEYAENAINAIK